MQKRTRALSIFGTVVLALCLTTLVLSPVSARIPDEVFSATYTMYGHHSFTTDGGIKIWDDCWVRGTIVVTYHFDRYGEYWIQYNYGGSYYEVGQPGIAFSADAKGATFYREGNGVTLKVDRNYYIYGSALYISDHIYLYVHYDELSGSFTSWGENILDSQITYFDWPIRWYG